MKVRVVSRPAFAAGFELAGLRVSRARDADAASHALEQLAADGDVGVVLVDEGLYRSLPRDLVGRLERRALPVIAPVPAPRWDERSAAEEFILDILRQAIGYRVRVR